MAASRAGTVTHFIYYYLTFLTKALAQILKFSQFGEVSLEEKNQHFCVESLSGDASVVAHTITASQDPHVILVKRTK